MTDKSLIVRRISTRKNVLSFLFAGVLLVLTVQSVAGFDWNAVYTSLSETDPVLFLLALVVFHGLSLVRSLRWRTLLKDAGYELTTKKPFDSIIELSRLIYLGWFANCITVARLGDMYRCSLLQRSTGIEFGVTAGTVLTERIVDLCVLVFALGVVTMIAFWGDLPSLITTMILTGTAFSGVGIIIMLLLRHPSEPIERLIPNRLHRYYEHLRRGTIDSLDCVPTLVGYTTIGWIIEGVTMYVVAVAIGVSLPFTSAFVAALVAVLLATVPVTPGGLGITEAGIALVLGWIGLDATAVAAVTILNRLISYWSVVCVGLLLYGIGLRFPIELSAISMTDDIHTVGGESRT